MRRELRIERPLGSTLRALRGDAGLSQGELAARLGTTQSAISRWEHDGDAPRLATLAEIARACGRTVTLVFDDGVDRELVLRRLERSNPQRLLEVANLARLRSLARRVA
jgi:transcriptional regulator with XRE-family HTH domain